MNVNALVFLLSFQLKVLRLNQAPNQIFPQIRNGPDSCVGKGYLTIDGTTCTSTDNIPIQKVYSHWFYWKLAGSLRLHIVENRFNQMMQ